MFINCFLVLMILSQNIPSPTEAKPYFTKIHRLNSVRDFDDIVDWTCNQNVKNQKQEPKGSKQITDNPSIQERSISSEAPDATSKSGELIEKRSDVSVHFETGETARATERMQVSIMPSPPSREYATSDKVRGTERIEVSGMPSPPSREDQKDDKKRSEVEEIKDVVDENEDNKEEFGEGFSNLYKKMRNKMKKKKCKTCLTNIEEEMPMRLEDIEDDKSKVKYILPYRRSAPLCLLNDRSAAGYYQTAAVPVIRPVLMSAPQPIYIQGSPNDDRSPLYEFEWLQHPSVATSMFRKRREIDNWYPKRAYPFMVDRECDHNDKVSQAHKELVCMIRAVKSEFLNKNNLTFLPILFVPHCDGSKPCPEIPGSAELGQLSFQNVDPSNMKEKEEEPHACPCAHPKDPAPKKGKNNEPLCINIGHMTIILLANNTLSVVFPAPSQEFEMPEGQEAPDTPEKPQQEAHSHRPQPSQSCCPPPPPPCCPPPPPPPQPEPVCFPPCPSPCPCPCPYPCRASEKNGQFKRNVIDNLKQYLENAFNFIDIRRVLTEDELHDRTSRDTFKRFGSDIIPGILLYPKRYGPTLAKSSREATNFDFEESGAPISDFYCFTTNGNTGGKFKRSLNSKKIGITEGDIAAEEAQLEIEKKQAQLEKEMQIDLNLDKEVVEALNVASTTASLAASEQMKKDEEYLEKENQEMIRNEQLLEAPDTGEEPTEQTCLFTEPLITEEIEPISSATDSVIENMSAEALAMAEAGHLDDAKGPEAEELQATEEALTETPVECPDPCPPEECGEPEPCQSDDEPCPPPCNEPTPPCHLPTSDEIGVNQTDLANESKGKASKSVAEFENEMLGIIDNSKKENLANEEKRKGVFDITTKHSWKVKKKRKSKRVRGLRAGQRNRRDLKATNPSTPGWKDSTTTSKMAVRDVETETTELVKVTFKETTSPVAICEEVEDVTEVLFTTKPSQEQMELECNEVKEAEVTPKSTTQKLGVPITIVITKSTEGVSTTTELPSVLSEYVQPPLRDENDETVTEKLNRLLRDLGLVKQVQSFLQGIKDTGYEIRDAVRRRTQRETPNDIGGLVTGRKLFSMEVHPKYSETKGPLQQFRRRTYRRRSGENFRRYSREINNNIQLYPGKANMDRILNQNNEESNDFTGNIASEEKRRAQLSKLPVLSSIASFFTSSDNQGTISDLEESSNENAEYDNKIAKSEDQIIPNEERNFSPTESKLGESDLLLYDDQGEYATESRKKRSFTVSNDVTDKSFDDPNTTEKHKERRALPSKDDLELGEISNALEEMMSTNYQLEKPKINTDTSSIDELMTPIEGLTTTERHFTHFHLKVEENFKDILDVEKSLDTTIPASTETTMSPFLLTEIPQISEEPFEKVTTLDQLLASVPSPTTYRPPTVDPLSIFDDLDNDVKVRVEDDVSIVPSTTTCKAPSVDVLSIFDNVDNHVKVSVENVVQKIKTPAEMLKKLFKKKKPTTTSTQRTTTTTERKKMLTTNQDEVMYPLDIETIEPGQEEEETVTCADSGGQCDILPSTTPECGFTAKGRIAHDDIRDNETEYYVDIVIPYDTDEQQQYIDRFEQDEPSYYSVLDHPRREQREDVDRKIWKEFKWPEHRKYQHTTTNSGAQNEMLVEEKKEGSSPELGQSDSDEREIWKEFKFPEHRKYGSSMTASSTTRREIEVITKDIGMSSVVEKLAKVDIDDRSKEFEGSLTTTEDQIDAESDAVDTAEDREIWKEFKWPDQKKYESLNIESLISTERELEGTTVDENIWEEFEWPENKEHGSFVLSSTEKSTPVSDFGKNIWREFKWPEHKKYGDKVSTERVGQSTIKESQEFDEYGTMSFSGLGTEITAKNTVGDYESELGIPEIPQLSGNSEWSPPAKVSSKIGETTQAGPTEGSAEWSEFNSPSVKTTQFTMEKYKYDDLPAKKKITLPGGVSINTAPMDESEAFTDNLGKTTKDVDGFKWLKKDKLPTSEGPHVMKTGLWEELHLPVHDTAHLKVIPPSTPWTVESTTYDRLARSTRGEIGVWNRFQWPEHKKYGTTEALTENVPLMETAIWNKMQDSAHFRVIEKTTESNKEAEIWRKFQWPSHNEYAEGRSTKAPLVMETVIWDKLHIPHHKTAHMKLVNDSGLIAENKEVGGKSDLSEKFVEDSSQIIRTTRGIETTESGDEVLPHFGGEKKHTTKIIEKSFSPEELTSKTYILEGTDKKTTTDIWEAFQWPPPRTPTPENRSESMVQGETSGPMDDFNKMENLTLISDSADQPDSSLDLFAFPSHDSKTEHDNNLTILDIPVPPFPPSQDYEEYSMLTSTDSSWPYNDVNLFSELNLPHEQEMSSTGRDTYADLMESLSLSSDELFPSSESPTDTAFEDATTESEKKMPFWDHVRKKVHRPKTTTTQGYPTKHTSPPTKYTTVGEHLELVEDISYKKQHGPNTEPSLHGPIKIPQERTIHTPVKESEDDDNLWDFRVLSEEEVVTFHSKTKKPTHKKTTIFSFKPIETTADDWEIFNEPAKEEVTKPLTESTVAEKKKTTFYVVITKPTEPSEPLEDVGETEKSFNLEPPPPVAPPGAVEQSTEYYDEEEEEESATQDYESGLDAILSKQVEKSKTTTERKLENVVTEENSDFTVGKVEDFETVTFRVSEVFVERTEPEPTSEIGDGSEENVELVTFRPFEGYPTDSKTAVSESVEEVMENLRDQNKEGFIDSLQLEQVTFRKSPIVEANEYTERIIQNLEENLSSESPKITLPETDIRKGDKDNLLYVLTEKSDFDWDLPENVVTGGAGGKPSVTVSVGVGEGTTKIIEGDKIMTEPYDHRSMSVPFNEKLEGAPDIIKEINKPNDQDDSPPLPPLSDLAADFLREQSGLGLNRDPYSVLERPPEKEIPFEDRELLRTDEDLKAPFTEENVEEDYATALIEPDRLEPGASAGEDSWKKSKHLLETSERYSVLEKLKKKLTNYRAKPITAGGGNEEGGNRGKEFHVTDRTTTENDSFGLSITYPEAVEAVVAVERTTKTPEAPVSKYEDQSTEKHLRTTHRTKDKFLELIDLEGQLERAELTESPIEDATTIPYMLTPIPDIVHRDRTTEHELKLTEKLVSKEIEESSENSDEESSSVDELSTELFPSEERLTSEIALSSVELPPDIEEIIKWEHDIETTEVLGTPEEEVSTSGGTTHHVATLTTKTEEPTTLGDIEKLIELEGALEEPSKIVSTSPASVETETITESPPEVVEEVLRTLDEFEMSPEVFTESSTEEFLVSSTHGTNVLSPEMRNGTEVTIKETETSTERRIPESTSLEPKSTSSEIVDEILSALEEPSKIVSTSPTSVEEELLTESPSEVVEEILRTLDEFEMSPEVFTESSTEQFLISSTHVSPEMINGTEVNRKETETVTERRIPESTSSEPTSTSSDIVDEILRTLDQFEVSSRVHSSLVTEEFRSTHGIDEVHPEEDSEEEVTETTSEIGLPTSTEPSDIVDEIIRTLGQFEISPEDYTESTTKEFHSTRPEEETSAEVTVGEHETTSEMEILELSTSSEAPSSTPDLVEEILRTLDKFEMSAETYTESIKEKFVSTHSEVNDEEVVGTKVTLGYSETTREKEVPELLTPLLFTEGKHIPSYSVSSFHAETSSRHHEFPTTANLATSPASTTTVNEEVYPQVIPTSVTEKVTHTSSQPEKVKTVENKPHIESVKEEQEEIETNLVHLPKDMHETSTICEICNQTDENEVSTVNNREFSSEKMLEQADEKYSEEEKVEEEKEEELTSLVSVVRTTERTAPVDDGLEEFDSNLMHLPKETHETSTICEICDEESSEEPGHLTEDNARIPTKKPEKLKEVESFTYKDETMTSTSPHKISHKEESEQEEFDSNMHHLPENTQHETSTICEICSEEDSEQFSTSSEENIVTLKSHQVTEKFSRASSRVETTSELTNHEKLEQEEFESNLHHLPENRVPETSTICEICTEEEEESISQTPKISTSGPSSPTISGEEGTTLVPTAIQENIATVKFSRTSVGLETTSELTKHEKLEQEEFDSNFHHFSEQNVQRTSTICEICTEEEGEGSVSGKPSFSKISTTEAPAHEFKSSQSPGESDKGFGFSEELPEGITEETVTEQEKPSVVTVVEGNVETTKGLTYKFEGEEIEQTMQTTNANVFKIGQHIPTLEGSTGGESGITTGFQTEGKTAKYTIEEIGITEALTEIKESTSEGYVSTESAESTVDEGLEAAKNIEHKLEETIKIQEELKAIEHEELETEIPVEEETEELKTTLVEISTGGYITQGEFTTVFNPNETHTIVTSEEGLTETTEMPTETNFYTEVKSSVKIEHSSTKENFSTHEVSTPKLEGTTREMFEVLQEIESIGEKSRTKTEEPHKITTPLAGVSAGPSQKEHTVVEVTELGLEDLEERGTTHLASDVSVLLKNFEDIQEELFISTLGMKDFTESLTVEPLIHSTEEYRLTESEEKTTWSSEEKETVPMEHGGEEHTSSERIGINETVGAAETTLESIQYESEAASSHNESEEATSTDFYTQIPSEHFELSTTLESIESELISTSKHKGTEEKEGSTDFYTEIPSGSFELTIPAGKEETTLEQTESELSSKHEVLEEEASTEFPTPSENLDLSIAAEKEDTTIEYGKLETESTSEHKGSEEEASTNFYTEIPSEISDIEVNEQTKKTTHSAQSSSTHAEGEIASDFYTEIPVVTPEFEITKGIEETSVESIHLGTGSTSKLVESEGESTSEITSIKPGITKGEQEEEATLESTHSQSQTISTTKKSEEEDFLELSREMTSESQPVEKPGENISTNTPSSETHIPEDEESTAILSSDILLSENVEKKLEELNKAVNEFLVTTPKKDSIGDLEEIKDQITENLILEKELEDLNKEFKEMMQTTLSAEDLLEGLEQTSHSVVKGTLEEFEITTQATEKTEGQTHSEITEETSSSEALREGTEHTVIEGTFVSTEVVKSHEVANTSIEITTLEEMKENKTESSSASSPGEKFPTPIPFSELEMQPSSEGIGVSEVTHHETSKLFTEYSVGEDVTGTMHQEVGTEKSSSSKYNTTKEQEISTNLYTKFISESITMSSSLTEEFQGNEITSVTEEVQHPTEQTLTTLLTSSEYALTESLEEKLSEIPTFPSTKEEFTEYSTEDGALGEEIEELKKEFEEIINATTSSEEPGMEEEEKIAEKNLATVYDEEKSKEITPPSPELELTKVSSESFEGLDEFAVTTVHEEQSERVLSDKIDTKLDELNEIIGEILNATSAPEKHVEGEIDLEEFTESDILEKELEELNKEFEEVLQTTLSSEEILEGIREPTETVGENEPKHSTTTKTGISHVATGSTKGELETSLGEKTTTAPSEETIEATESITNQLVQGTTEIETSVETEAKSTKGDEVVTEKEISEDLKSGTNFYTAIATASPTETTAEMENMEEKSTEVLATEKSARIVPVASEKAVTDKLEKKLEELDEIINEFLTSTPKIEIMEETLGNEEQNTEEEDFEKELEELKHEFQLMLSTTISPDNLLGAVEDALFPTTEGSTTSGGYETSVAASTEVEIETEELSRTKVIENNTETAHDETIGEEGIIHTTMTEAEKHEGSSEGVTGETTPKEKPLEVETMGSSELTTVLGNEETAHRSTNRISGGEEESTLESERSTESDLLEAITHHIETVSGTAYVSHPSTSEGMEFPEKVSTEEVSSSGEGGGGTETSEVTITLVEVSQKTVGKITETETQEVLHNEITSEGSVVSSYASEVHEKTPTLSEEISTEAEISGTKFPEKKTKVTESLGTEKSVSYSNRQTEKVGSTSETTTSKSHVTEGLSSISLLTTLLLSLVTSTTQTPEKNNTVSSQFASNISGPPNIPKCLVVFITGESPLLPLNGTKWVPSECPRLGEESTTSHALDIMTSGQETTSIATTLESTISVSETPSDNETLPSTTELITTTLVPVEELPEIRTKNYVEDGCAEADFENNNKCFCMLDMTVDHVAVVLEGGNSSKTNNVKCSKFLKVNKGLVMRNDTMAALKRSRRSYLYLKYLNRQRRETVEYNKIDEVLANELIATCTDTTIYSATGGTATIPCVYKDEVIEREHFMKYLWTADGDKTIIFSDRIREATDGALKIAEVAVEDGGNYTCSINRPFGNTDSEHKHYVHELLVIEKPIFKVKSTVMYVTDDTCSLKDGDVVHAYLPKMLEDLLCGIHKRVCKVEMERPSCVEEEGTTYLTVKYVVTLDAMSSLIPSISSSECDFNCQMKVMGSLVSLLIKNVETTSVLDVISEIQSFNHTFKPREVKFPTERSAAEDASLLPKLVIGCPSGFGIQKSTNKICVACPRNTYNSENSSICSPCPRIHYQPKLGSSSCIECKTPFDDKACVGMMFANKTFLILYVGSSIAIVFFLLLCIFCAQSSTQAAFGGSQKKKRAQTPKRRRIGRKDVEDPAEKPLLPKDPSIPKIVKGPKVPPPDF